jgi:hypothetical protein
MNELIPLLPPLLLQLLLLLLRLTLWWCDVLDLVAHALQPPRLCCCVDGRHNGQVERLTLLKGLVKCDLTQLTAE